MFPYSDHTVMRAVEKEVFSTVFTLEHGKKDNVTRRK